MEQTFEFTVRIVVDGPITRDLLFGNLRALPRSGMDEGDITAGADDGDTGAVSADVVA